MPDPNSTLMIEMAKRKMSQEMPEEYKSASIKPMGPISRFFFGGRADALTTPFNTIYYDPGMTQGRNQPRVEDILAHELTHVRQNNQLPMIPRLMQLFKSSNGDYQQRPNEMEAYQTEKDRILRDHRPGNPFVPQFGENSPVGQGDIPLPTKHAKR